VKLGDTAPKAFGVHRQKVCATSPAANNIHGVETAEMALAGAPLMTNGQQTGSLRYSRAEALRYSSLRHPPIERAGIKGNVANYV